MTALAAWAGAISGWSIDAFAQRDFPTRSVRMVNPYTPGGSVDLVGRVVAGGLSESWKEQVIVDNRPGAGTMIGTEIVVRAEPDGYTMLCTSSAIAIIRSMYLNMRFDPLLDLTPVILIANSPSLLVVHPSLPANSVADLIALAKAQPGQIAAASSGVGTTTHLTLQMFKSMTHADLLHVPYKGGGPAVADLIGGQVKVFFNTPGLLLPHVTSGRLRALAVTSAQRTEFAARSADGRGIGRAGIRGQYLVRHLRTEEPSRGAHAALEPCGQRLPEISTGAGILPSQFHDRGRRHGRLVCELPQFGNSAVGSDSRVSRHQAAVMPAIQSTAACAKSADRQTFYSRLKKFAGSSSRGRSRRIRETAASTAGATRYSSARCSSVRVSPARAIAESTIVLVASSMDSFDTFSAPAVSSLATAPGTRCGRRWRQVVACS